MFNINEENYSVLLNLTPNSEIGVKKDGSLYAVKSTLQKIINDIWLLFSFSYANKLAKATQNVIEHYYTKKITPFKENEAPPAQNLINLIKNTSRLGLLNIQEFSHKLTTYYDKQYDDLVASGESPENAEAIVTINMSLDPNISSDIKKKIRPIPTVGGTSGSYFIHNRQGKKIGIFKPSDEEVFMPNNPRGKSAKYIPAFRIGPRGGHEQGTSWKKEIAAYTLDQANFVGVPKTTQLKVPFPRQPDSKEIIEKTGSFQLFASGTPIDELTASQCEEIPTEQVHKIALFDLILGNSDRNLGNMLWDKDKKVLTPIDHGLCFLDSLDWEGDQISETSCHWVTWPQIKQPIPLSVKEWIRNLDFNQLSATLKAKAKLSDSSLREFEIRLSFVKFAVEKGFSLEEISKMSMRLSENEPCFLDSTVRETAAKTSKDADFIASFLKSLQEKMSTKP